MSVSNSFDRDQARRIVGPDLWSKAVFKSFQQKTRLVPSSFRQRKQIQYSSIAYYFNTCIQYEVNC